MTKYTPWSGQTHKNYIPCLGQRSKKPYPISGISPNKPYKEVRPLPRPRASLPAAQWLEHPTGVRKVISSPSVVD